MATNIGEVKAKITGDASSFTQAAGEAEESVFGLQGAFGALLGAAGAFAAGNFFQNAIEGALELEREITELQKLAGVELGKEISQDVKELSEDLPIARRELLKIAQQGARFGVEGREEILDFTESVARIKLATNLTAREAGRDFAKIAGQMEVPISRIDDLADIINKLGDNMKTSQSEILRSVQRSSAAMNRLGLQEEQIIALNAVMNEQSATARLGATANESLAEELLNPQDVQQLARSLGLTVKQFREMKSEAPIKIIERAIDVIGKGTEESKKLNDVLGDPSIRALSNLRKGWESYSEAMNSTTTQSAAYSSAQREVNRIQQTTSAEVTKLNNKWNNMVDKIGTELFPVTEELVEVLSETIDIMRDLEIPGFIGFLGDIAANVTRVVNAILDLVQLDVSGAFVNFLQLLEDLNIVSQETVESFEPVSAEFDEAQQAAQELDEEIRTGLVESSEELNIATDQLGPAVVRAWRKVDEASDTAEESQEKLKSLIASKREAKQAASNLGLEWSELSKSARTELVLLANEGGTSMNELQEKTRELTDTTLSSQDKLDQGLEATGTNMSDFSEKGQEQLTNLSTKTDSTTNQIVKKINEIKPATTNAGKGFADLRKTGLKNLKQLRDEMPRIKSQIDDIITGADLTKPENQRELFKKLNKRRQKKLTKQFTQNNLVDPVKAIDEIRDELFEQRLVSQGATPKQAKNLRKRFSGEKFKELAKKIAPVGEQNEKALKEARKQIDKLSDQGRVQVLKELIDRSAFTNISEIVNAISNQRNVTINEAKKLLNQTLKKQNQKLIDSIAEKGKTTEDAFAGPVGEIVKRNLLKEDELINNLSNTLEVTQSEAETIAKSEFTQGLLDREDVRRALAVGDFKEAAEIIADEYTQTKEEVKGFFNDAKQIAQEEAPEFVDQVLNVVGGLKDRAKEGFEFFTGALREAATEEAESQLVTFLENQITGISVSQAEGIVSNLREAFKGREIDIKDIINVGTGEIDKAALSKNIGKNFSKLINKKSVIRELSNELQVSRSDVFKMLGGRRGLLNKLGKKQIGKLLATGKFDAGMNRLLSGLRGHLKNRLGKALGPISKIKSILADKLEGGMEEADKVVEKGLDQLISRPELKEALALGDVERVMKLLKGIFGDNFDDIEGRAEEFLQRLAGTMDDVEEEQSKGRASKRQEFLNSLSPQERAEQAQKNRFARAFSSRAGGTAAVEGVGSAKAPTPGRLRSFPGFRRGGFATIGEGGDRSRGGSLQSSTERNTNQLKETLRRTRDLVEKQNTALRNQQDRIKNLEREVNRLNKR